ncbi:sigma-54-dependent transcriptional regulator [Desulfopila aestuarii]|uniref:Two-component system, NtrC family, response regulator AlgB n=1 Tax=Desulfopila aestuarii DSM 18488 TaxID=1121416 RepID=A0A1M7XVW0_9BACT|nr:sigma-54 dependent transcriptional regulator [Desulfopila aestuarii]SHO42795.1 two-component system, NtrC family, response regulator AlgB [Desulfopila aestuarii DSM 18488]
MQKALLIDDDRNIAQTLSIYLAEKGFTVLQAGTGSEGLATFKQEKPDLVLLDLHLPDVGGMEVLEKMIASGLSVQIVVITAYATVETAVSAIRMGAADYLPKPFVPGQLDLLLEKIGRIRVLKKEVARLKGIFREGELLTRSPRMRHVLETAKKAAKASAIVLISGESGTGKGLLARLIHQWSNRGNKPFITVDCAGLQENLLESDLFGHVKGAFTGAMRDKIGKMSMADRGTLFLDEVSELPTVVQGKLLRFLQYQEFERLGDPRTLNVDVRVIAATNKDLEELVRDGIFRKDLYFRLRVIEIFLPPLRERVEDIPLLLEDYLRRFCLANSIPPKDIDETDMQLLQRYPWPGNVRELQHAVERAAVLSSNSRLELRDFPPYIAEYRHPAKDEERCLISLAEMEKRYIQEVMLHCGSLEGAAAILGINATTLWRKRKQYHLD